MKPSWDMLMTEYKDNETVLIADVDCIDEGKTLCEAFDVKSYPTIKYGDPNSLEDYVGGRNFPAMFRFAAKLAPRCGPSHLHLCTSSQKSMLETFQNMQEEDLMAKIAEKEAAMNVTEEEHKALTKEIETEFHANKDASDSKKKVIDDSGHRLLKAVLEVREGSKGEL